MTAVPGRHCALEQRQHFHVHNNNKDTFETKLLPRASSQLCPDSLRSHDMPQQQQTDTGIPNEEKARNRKIKNYILCVALPFLCTL